MVSLDGESHHLLPGALVNVPTGHGQAFAFKPNTKGWVATFPEKLLDAILVHVCEVRTDLGRVGVLLASPSMHLVMQNIWEEFSGRCKARAHVLRGLSSTLLGLLAWAMNIIHTMASDARTTQAPKRRFYSPELKLQVVSACAQPGAALPQWQCSTALTPTSCTTGCANIARAH